MKLIVKHIKPYLASQLRGRVNDVDELVRLGHQLERDHDQQLEYVRNLHMRKVNSMQKGTYPGSQQGEKTPLCWHCKGLHSPGSCPQYTSTSSKFVSQHHKQRSDNSKTSTHSSKSSASAVTSKQAHKKDILTPSVVHPFQPGNAWVSGWKGSGNKNNKRDEQKLQLGLISSNQGTA